MSLTSEMEALRDNINEESASRIDFVKSLKDETREMLKTSNDNRLIKQKENRKYLMTEVNKLKNETKELLVRISNDRKNIIQEDVKRIKDEVDELIKKVKEERSVVSKESKAKLVADVKELRDNTRTLLKEYRTDIQGAKEAWQGKGSKKKIIIDPVPVPVPVVNVDKDEIFELISNSEKGCKMSGIRKLYNESVSNDKIKEVLDEMQDEGKIRFYQFKYFISEGV